MDKLVYGLLVMVVGLVIVFTGLVLLMLCIKLLKLLMGQKQPKAAPVSYTQLDVYKRQCHLRRWTRAR